MTKSERNIISAINNIESNEEVTYLRGALFIDIKGISQNFAFIENGHVFLRIDNNCKGIIRKCLKHYNLIEHTLCLVSDRISKKLISKYHEKEFMEDVSSVFDYFDIKMINLFIKYEVSFKELVLNGVEYFGCQSEFLELINDGDFWRGVIRSRETWVWVYDRVLPLSDTEQREFIKNDWIEEMTIRERSKILEDLTNDL